MASLGYSYLEKTELSCKVYEVRLELTINKFLGFHVLIKFTSLAVIKIDFTDT
jgi:hypothetical protein